MALLGAALAPVIHCSNWANRSIYFLVPVLWKLGHETDGAAFGYRARIAWVQLMSRNLD
jgi:hypothetical protein